MNVITTLKARVLSYIATKNKIIDQNNKRKIDILTLKSIFFAFCIFCSLSISSFSAKTISWWELNHIHYIYPKQHLLFRQ